MKFPVIFFQSALFRPVLKYHKISLSEDYEEIAVSPSMKKIVLFSKGSELFQADLRVFVILSYYMEENPTLAWCNIDDMIAFGGKVKNIKLRKAFINSLIRLSKAKVYVENNGIAQCNYSLLHNMAIKKNMVKFKLPKLDFLECVEFPLEYFQNTSGRLLMSFFWESYKISKQDKPYSVDEITWLINLATGENDLLNC